VNVQKLYPTPLGRGPQCIPAVEARHVNRFPLQNGHLGPPTFVTPFAGTERLLAGKDRGIEKVKRRRARPASGGGQFPGLPPGLTARRASALILGWGALGEGEDQASDGRCNGRGTLQEKSHWRPVAPTLLGE